VAAVAWNGSRDLVAWSLLHEVKADDIDRFESPHALRARLTRAQSDLGELPPVERQFWRSRLESVLNPPAAADEPQRGFDEPAARSMLHEYLRALYDWRDTKFVNLRIVRQVTDSIAPEPEMAVGVSTRRS
jgi:hypothetical protein